MTDDGEGGPDDDRQEEGVGYRRPPKKHQWRKGQSGNPGGKISGSKGLKSELRSELAQLVTITTDGKSRRVPKRLLVLRALIAKAAKGDVRAADKLISLIIQMEGFEDQRVGRKSLSDNDMQILDLLFPGDPATHDPAAVAEAGSDDAGPEGESDQQTISGEEE